MSTDSAKIHDSLVDPNDENSEIILGSLSEGVCQLDKDGRILYANKSACRLFDKTNASILGKPYEEIFYPMEKNFDREFCPINFVLTEGQISHVKTDTFSEEDSKKGFLVEFMCVPIKSEGEFNGAVLSFQDITERREAEIAVSEARDAALDAARTKAEFLANMSHEIRTPLSGIIGTAELLLESDLDEQQRKYAETLSKSGNLLTHIVNDILDFSKNEAGKLERERIEIDLRQLATEMSDLFTPLAEKKNISIKLKIDESIKKPHLGDLKSVRQVLSNFLSNAIKFTDDGDVVLEVKLLSKDGESDRIKVSVADSGIGIDEKSQKRLFQPFTQADSSTTRKFGGTGLGLAICKQLVEALDGEIGFESEFEKGSKFWFECSFKRSKEGFIERRKVKRLEPTEKQVKNPEGLRVLIVEDNPTNLSVALEMFQILGIDARGANDGTEAVNEVSKDKFDLVLMDLHLPDIDGFEAAKSILEKNTPANNPKIVAFTASVEANEREKCYSAGMVDILTKPYTKQDILNVLNKHFVLESVRKNLDLPENLLQHSLSKIIDPGVLKNLLEIEADKQNGFIREIFDVYFKHSAERIEESKKAIVIKDLDVVQKNAHNLKGSSSSLGLSSVAYLFEKLESELNDWAIIENTLNEIENVLTKTKTIIYSGKA